MKKRSAILSVLLLEFLGCLGATAQTATLTTLYYFDGTAGSRPRAGLIQGANGNFYGVGYQGGTSGLGTIFEMFPGGVVTNLWNFDRTTGASPSAPFIIGNDGNFYGESLGGAFGNGTIFQLTPGGGFTNIVSFEPPDGVSPSGPLLQGRDGNFYGVTQQSAFAGSDGTVYRLTPDGTVTNLYSFSGPDGNNPSAGLAQGPDGMLYGTTLKGGTNNLGTIYKITTNGAFQSLWSFNGTNGSFPESAPLVFGPDAALYGTTDAGGSNGNSGTIFRITTNDSFTSLVSLDGNEQGGAINAGLVLASDHTFYGVTSGGNGTIFQVTTNGVFTTVYAFDGTQGVEPQGTLIQGMDGNLYGTTSFDGVNNLGTIFMLNLSGSSVPAPVILSIGQTDGVLNLTWSSISNLNYQLQFNTDLTTPNWTNLHPPQTATDITTSDSDAIGPDTQRFYRVVLMQ